MRRGRIVLLRVRSLLRSSRADAEMQQELAIHIEQLTREYANTAIFRLVDAVLLRTLPVQAPSQLVEISRDGGRTSS